MKYFHNITFRNQLSYKNLRLLTIGKPKFPAKWPAKVTTYIKKFLIYKCSAETKISEIAH